MRSIIPAILAFTLSAVVAGCAAHMGAPRMNSEARNAILSFQPSVEESGLYILGIADNAYEVNVFVNGRFVTTLSTNEAAFVRIVPGTHLIGVSDDKKTLNVPPNAVRYVTVDVFPVRSAWWKPIEKIGMRIGTATEARGKQLVRRANLVMATKRKVTSTMAE